MEHVKSCDLHVATLVGVPCCVIFRAWFACSNRVKRSEHMLNSQFGIHRQVSWRTIQEDSVPALDQYCSLCVCAGKASPWSSSKINTAHFIEEEFVSPKGE